MDVANKNGFGVCRNMSDYIADELNAINKDYDARTITVYSDYDNYGFNNIEIKTLNDDGSITISKGNKKNVYYNDTLVRSYEKIDSNKIKYNYDQNEDLRSKEITNDDFICIEWYDNDKNVVSRTIADKDEDVSEFFENGKLNFRTTVRGDKQITEYFDTNSNVVKKNESKASYKNRYLEEKKLEEEEEKQIFKEKLQRYANHAVVKVDVKEDNTTIILDPTNGGIGVYKDGQITMFNETGDKKHSLIRESKSDMDYSGTEGLIEYPIELIKSFRNSNLSMDELREKYGISAQNKALKKVCKKEKNENDFKESLKVSEADKENKECNVVYNSETKKAKVFGEEIDLSR